MVNKLAYLVFICVVGLLVGTGVSAVVLLYGESRRPAPAAEKPLDKTELAKLKEQYDRLVKTLDVLPASGPPTLTVESDGTKLAVAVDDRVRVKLRVHSPYQWRFRQPGAGTYGAEGWGSATPMVRVEGAVPGDPMHDTCWFIVGDRRRAIFYLHDKDGKDVRSCIVDFTDSGKPESTRTGSLGVPIYRVVPLYSPLYQMQPRMIRRPIVAGWRTF